MKAGSGLAALGAALLLAATLLARPAAAGGYPACGGAVEVSGEPIVRVEDNGVLVLHDGRAADLEGIVLPGGSDDHAASLYKRQALAAIRGMTDGHDVTLVVDRPKEDRYGRLRAQVSAHGDWVQIALLKAGLARVDVAPDRQQCAEPLFAAEREARAARRGIWASSAYAVKGPDGLKGAAGTFQIVQGTVKSVSIRNGRAYLNFGEDWRSDFTATVAPDDMAYFRADGRDLKALVGATVRVRGMVDRMNGPELQLDAPQDIELVGAAQQGAWPLAARF